ncbi:hypothetical protein ACFSUS_11360 [Spirosoma soli]|uniref:Glycerophosphoryl diester phosphodiesterase membrane domain-containing protein n=1 Tax=Spirosoma soli TaxID=1770529 RepID=A0ABW5M2F8_9BACT
MINLYQQRDFGNKINVTFQYVTENFRSFGLSLLYIVGPVALVAGIASGVLQSNLLNLAKTSADSGGAQNPMAVFQLMQNMFSPSFWLTIFFGILAILVVSLTTYTHMKVYARKNGEFVTVAEVWEEMQPVIGRGLVISILGSIITGVGFLFFVIPGIYVAIVLVLALAVTTFEGTDFGRTWDRCFKLIRDKWWSTFGLVLVMGLISGLIGLIFTLPAGIISFLVSAKLLPDVSNVWVVLGNVIGTVGGTLLRSLIYVAIGFQYTNLVERQEGRGLMSAIDSIGTAPTRPRATDEGDY